MTQEFVNYNQALALKELGFDEPCLAFYDGKNTESFYFNNLRDASGDYIPFQKHDRLKWFGAPLKQQVFRWFRDKYDLWFRPDYYDEMREYDYQGSIHQLGRYSSLASLDNCKTVEELEAKCIDKLIEIVKNK